MNTEPWIELQNYNKQDSLLSSLGINEYMKIKIKYHPFVFLSALYLSMRPFVNRREDVHIYL